MPRARKLAREASRAKKRAQRRTRQKDKHLAQTMVAEVARRMAQGDSEESIVETLLATPPSHVQQGTPRHREAYAAEMRTYVRRVFAQREAAEEALARTETAAQTQFASVCTAEQVERACIEVGAPHMVASAAVWQQVDAQ